MFAKEGLEGVVAARRGLSLIDGEKGRLSYRGYSIHELAEHSSFEEVVHLLWYGEPPTRAQLDRPRRELSSQRGLHADAVEILRRFARDASPMDMMRTVVSALAIHDPDVHESTRESNLRKGIRLTAQLPTIVTAHERLRKGKDPIPPDPGLDHCANYLYMLHGRKPETLNARALVGRGVGEKKEKEKWVQVSGGDEEPRKGRKNPHPNLYFLPPPGFPPAGVRWGPFPPDLPLPPAPRLDRPRHRAPPRQPPHP